MIGGERYRSSMCMFSVSHLHTPELIDSFVDCLPYLVALFIPGGVALGGTRTGPELRQQAVLVDIEFRRSPDINRVHGHHLPASNPSPQKRRAPPPRRALRPPERHWTNVPSN